jgi:hypothetical protein
MRKRKDKVAKDRKRSYFRVQQEGEGEIQEKRRRKEMGQKDKEDDFRK